MHSFIFFDQKYDAALRVERLMIQSNEKEAEEWGRTAEPYKMDNVHCGRVTLSLWNVELVEWIGNSLALNCSKTCTVFLPRWSLELQRFYVVRFPNCGAALGQLQMLPKAESIWSLVQTKINFPKVTAPKILHSRYPCRVSVPLESAYRNLTERKLQTTPSWFHCSRKTFECVCKIGSHEATLLSR